MSPDDEATRRAREAARSLEKRGLVDPAVQTYLRIGDVDAASSALVGARRFAEAAQVIMRSLGVAPSRVASVDPGGRKLALKAAICFAQAGDATSAVEIYLALGESQRAAETLEKAGDLVGAARIRGGIAGATAPAAQPAAATAPRATSFGAGVPASGGAMNMETATRLEQSGNAEMALAAYVQLKQLGHAGRVARQLGRRAEAARLFAEAGMAYKSAVCWMEVGDTGQCLDALVRVPRDDPRYRRAALQAVRLASDLNVLDFNLEHFLSRFLAVGPEDEREQGALYLLARLYEKHDFQENAKDAYRKLLAVAPGFRDAAARLAEVERESRGSAMVFRRILEEDMAFRREDARKPLSDEPPPLPNLPDLPPIPGPLGVGGATAHWDGRRGAPAVVRVTPEPAASPIVPASPSHRGATVAEMPAHAAARPPSAPPPADGPVGDAALAEGATIAGRYHLVKKIGQGGMAAVFKATDLELSETIAIKFFTQIITDEQMLLRFKQELTLSRQLTHPNIVRLYDIGSHRGMRFITMELLVGDDLRSRMARPYTLVEALDWLIQACAGLQVAHDRGVIHRDIKPENFFVTREGVLKVMDFGIAKRTTTQGLTQAGMMAGTPEYMSPEQVTSFANVTHATDLYALGVIAFELFAGSVPFSHPELLPLLMMHVQQPPPSPRQRNPSMPADLEPIILKLLAKDPAARYRSCDDLAAALRAVQATLAGG